MRNRNLDRRLQQRGRRSGAMVGISILAAMALGVTTFVFIYALIDPLTNDFISKDGTEANPLVAFVQPTNMATTAAEPTATASEITAFATSTPVVALFANGQITAEAPSFLPNYRVSATRRINLRLGPGTNSGVVVVLAPGTTLEFLSEEQVTTNPRRDGLPQGGRWLKFRTEQGDEGWIREVDVTPITG